MTSTETPKEPREAEHLRTLSAVGRAIKTLDLTLGPSGNVSVRTGSDSFLISASGIALDELEWATVTKCSISRDEWHGERRPSSEVSMHREIYAMRSDVGSVLHVTPLHVTLCASSNMLVRTDLTTDTAYYLRSVATVPVFNPGSRELAHAVADAVKNADVVLLRNHGCVVCAPDATTALEVASALEFLCHMLLVAAPEVTLQPLTREQVESWLRHVENTSSV